ncbi:MAG: DUF6786 family protein [Pontiella sp.]
MGIERTVKLRDKKEASELLGVELGEGLRMVGYEIDNRITNTGSNAWKPETGSLPIWMLGRYNSSPETSVVIPFKKGAEKDLGPRMNDTYFGRLELARNVPRASPEATMRSNRVKRCNMYSGPSRSKVRKRNPIRSNGVCSEPITPAFQES